MLKKSFLGQRICYSACNVNTIHGEEMIRRQHRNQRQLFIAGDIDQITHIKAG